MRKCVADLEEWKDILDLPDRVILSDRYQVSNFGNIRRKSYIKVGSNGSGSFSFLTKPKDMSQRISHKGYKVISISRKHEGVEHNLHLQVHRLVAEAFIGEPQVGQQVNHIDGNKLNNSVNNLEWVSACDNVRHSYKTGLASNANSRHPSALFTNEEVIKMRKLRERGLSYKEISELFNAKYGTVLKIVNGKNYRTL